MGQQMIIKLKFLAMNIKIIIIFISILFIMANCNSSQSKNGVYRLIEIHPRFDDSNNFMLPLINMVGGDLHDYKAQIKSEKLVITYKDSMMYETLIEVKDNKIKTADNTYELLNESNRLILINHNSDSIVFELN